MVNYSSEESRKRKQIDHEKVGALLGDVEQEIGKIVVGQKKMIHALLRAILCDGHVLVEGVPGVAKTLIVKAIATVLGCESQRIQFTVDLLPTDITGIQSYTPGQGFEIMKGPVFTHFLLADEINRSPPKTQSALLEAMQEKKVTISRSTYDLPSPFFVMATQNPLENSGVYELPEAQVDRFLFKLVMDYPDAAEEIDILETNMTLRSFESFSLRALLNPTKIKSLQQEVHYIYASDVIKKYIVDIIRLTRGKDFDDSKYVLYGASPRASISLYIASKAEALMQGRNFVTPDDVRNVVHPILRHRLILNYQADAEGITTDHVIDSVLSKVVTL